VATPILTIAPLEGDELELRTHALSFVPGAAEKITIR